MSLLQESKREKKSYIVLRYFQVQSKSASFLLYYSASEKLFFMANGCNYQQEIFDDYMDVFHVRMSVCFRFNTVPDMKINQIELLLRIVRGDRDSRANLMPIYGDLYQIKLSGITNENHLVTLLGFTS